MNFRLLIVVTLWSWSALAGAKCPDLSGVYHCSMNGQQTKSTIRTIPGEAVETFEIDGQVRITDGVLRVVDTKVNQAFGVKSVFKESAECAGGARLITVNDVTHSHKDGRSLRLVTRTTLSHDANGNMKVEATISAYQPANSQEASDGAKVELVCSRLR